MKFMEAQEILASFQGGPPLEFLLAMSGQPEPLQPFLAAAAAERGAEARVRTLPFNTLAQALRAGPLPGEVEVFLLFPWDLVADVDWRSGFPSAPRELPELVAEARASLQRVTRRNRPPILFVDAPVPEIFPDHHRSRALPEHLRAAALEAGARLMPADCVSFENLFRSGCPLASGTMGTVAREVIAAALDPHPSRGKVLVTDFDNTLWFGVVGEDGVDGLHFGPQGLGFPHFVYQSFLRRLKANGVLVAGVTKNDPDLACAPLGTPESLIRQEDFVSILASYNPKSSQIEELARQLNLGLNAFAFVDDNPVELAEVGRALPQVELVRFPEGVAGLPAFFSHLSRFFHREGLTDEDRQRTEMYRRRLAGMVPKDVEAADVTSFLAGLEMRLTIRDRSGGDRDRAVQLINKTNQFNMNGVRRPDEEVAAILQAGGRLYTASLADRHGSHGEILSCLLNSEGSIISFVMSCRVFERRVEAAFLVWLSNRLPPVVRLDFVQTERNEPFRRFLRDPAASADDQGVSLNLREFAEAHGDDFELFQIQAE